MSFTRRYKMNRFVGKVFAILFGLILLIEVGGLPLFSSLAVKFEKTVVAELSDKEDSEKTESLAEALIAVVCSEKAFPDPSDLFASKNQFQQEKTDGSVQDHVFLKHRSLRI